MKNIYQRYVLLLSAPLLSCLFISSVHPRPLSHQVAKEKLQHVDSLKKFYSLSQRCKKALSARATTKKDFKKYVTIIELVKHYKTSFKTLDKLSAKELVNLSDKCSDTLSLLTVTRSPFLLQRPQQKKPSPLAMRIDEFLLQNENLFEETATNAQVMKRAAFKSAVIACSKMIDMLTAPRRAATAMPTFNERVKKFATIPTKETWRKYFVTCIKSAGFLGCDELLEKGVRTQKQSLFELLVPTAVGAICAVAALSLVARDKVGSTRSILINVILDLCAKAFLSRWYIPKKSRYYGLANVAAMTVPFFKGSTFRQLLKSNHHPLEKTSIAANALIDTGQAALIYDVLPLLVSQLLPKPEDNRFLAPTHRRTFITRLVRDFADNWARTMTQASFESATQRG